MNRSRYRRVSQTALFAAALSVGAVSISDAATVTWIGGNNAAWNEAGNWNPAALPQAGDDCMVRNTSVGTLGLLYPSSANSTVFGITIDATVTSGTMTFHQSGGALTAAAINVGRTNNGNYVLNGGTLLVNRPGSSELSVGVASTSFGSFSLNNGTLITGLTTVGYFGNGQFTQTNGSHNTGFLQLGYGLNSTGRYTLNGGDLNVSGYTYVGDLGPGTFEQNAGNYTGYRSILGLGTAAGTMTTNGGNMIMSDEFIVGENSPGRWNFNGGYVQVKMLEVGYFSSGAIEQGAGVVEATQQINVGLRGAAYWHINSPDAQVTAPYVWIGQFDGPGTVVQDAGSFASQGFIKIGERDGANGTLALNGGTVSSLSMQVGYTGGGQGTFSQSGGLNATGPLWVGGAGQGIGYYKMTGGTTSTTAVTSSGVIDISGGTMTVAGNVGSIDASSGSIGISGTGTLRAKSVQQKQLTINGGQLLLNTNGDANAPVNKVQNLAMSKTAGAYNGKLDLNDGDLIVTGTLANQVRDMVVKGRSNGAWSGTGIASSYAANHPGTALGFMSGSEYRAIYGGSATFDGAPVATSDLLIKHTYNGDTDFNGKVNFDDYVRIDNGFNNHLSGWVNGDFDYNGVVNFDDYVLIDFAFNNQSGTLGRAVQLVEGDPSGAGMDDTALRTLVRHREQFGDAYARAFLSAVPEPEAVTMCGFLAAAASTLRRRRISRAVPRSRGARSA
jgi:hypothetical protein